MPAGRVRFSQHQANLKHCLQKGIGDEDAPKYSSREFRSWTVHAENGNAKGMLGRMVARLTNKTTPFKSAMYSLQGYQRMLTGAPFVPEIIKAGEGIIRYSDYGNLAKDIARMTTLESESLMAETYAAVLESSLRSTEMLGKALGNTTLITFEGDRCRPRELPSR